MTAQTEVTGVNNAVQRLLELADRMRVDDFGFSENDIKNIDNVIESLQELDKERINIHDALETETIRGSVQRHKLQFLPMQIKNEIAAAVNSARQSNAADLKTLQDQLDGIDHNIIFLEKRHKELDEDNAILHPERELLRQQHEEIISQLNQRMAEKASMQIILNETRDKVRQTNQQIINLEDGILQLKDDLITERGDARSEKKDLKKEVAETTEKTKAQRKTNLEKKKELDIYNAKLLDSEGRVDNLRRSIYRYETSRTKLAKEEQSLAARLERQLQQNEELRETGASIRAEDKKEKAEFENQEAQLQKKLKKMENEIQRESEKNEDLEARKLELHVELGDKQKIRQSDQERVKSLDEGLQAEKRQLAMKAEEVGRMQTENVDMTDAIENLGESHKAVSAQLNKLVEDYRDTLSKERTERMEVQEKKNETHKDLEEYKMENQRFMTEMNKKVQDGKSKHIELSNEGSQLQREMRQDDTEIDEMQKELDQTRKEYEEVFDTLQTKVSTTEAEILEMEQGVINKTRQLEEDIPVFEELEKKFQARTEAYENMKKSIVALKNKRMGLEDAIAKAKRERLAMVEPQDKLQEDMKKNRGASLSQLKQQGEEKQVKEREIYVSGCKLQTVTDENRKFEDACKQLEWEINDLQQQNQDNEEMKRQLAEILAQLKAKLSQKWDEDNDMEELYAERDQQIVVDLDNLLSKAGKRELKIGEITTQLHEELLVLASFLENLATRRPRESRESRRPATRASQSSRPQTRASHRSAPQDQLDLGEPPNLELSRGSTTPMTSRPATKSAMRVKGADAPPKRTVSVVE